VKLHDFALSGNCWKVRLFLSLLGIPYESVPVDLLKGANRAPEFLAKNPLGQVPVLENGSVTLRDSQAILVHLAPEEWLPRARLAENVAWLSTAAHEVAEGPARLRLAARFGLTIDEERARQLSTTVLNLVEAQLQRTTWLTGDRPTVADVAVYPYLKLAPEGGVDLAPYSAIQAWFARFEALPGYVPLT